MEAATMMDLQAIIIRGRWPEIKGELQKVWDTLTDNELEETCGNIEDVQELINQKYGDTMEICGRKVLEIFQRFDVPTQQGGNLWLQMKF